MSKYVHGIKGTWQDAGDDDGLQSCAVRMSLALAHAGLKFLPFKNCWRFKYLGLRYWLPSLAADFPGLQWKNKSWGQMILEPGELVTDKDLQAIKGRTGILYFGPGHDASGHLTLWNGEKVHFPQNRDNFSHNVPKIYFWEIPNA